MDNTFANLIEKAEQLFEEKKYEELIYLLKSEELEEYNNSTLFDGEPVLITHLMHVRMLFYL